MPDQHATSQNFSSVGEPVWCSFCQDRPAVGRLVVMQDHTRTILGELDGPNGVACDLHGRAWTGSYIATNNKTGAVAVLQYVHPDFEKVTEKQIVDFSRQQVCSQCGKPIEGMPLWFAERILRAYPQLVFGGGEWDMTCPDCTGYSRE